MVEKDLSKYGTGGMVGLVVGAIINLGIFATKADVADLKAEIALRYAQKTEIIAQLDKLETKIEKLINQVDSLKSK
jgi:hypothetical protein